MSSRHAPDDGFSASETFDGYARDGGSVGVRNRVVVLPSVICSHAVADRIADAVPGAVSTPHDHGCAQLGDDSAQTERTFVGIGTNPNVAGTLVVGLGCETIQSGVVVDGIRERGVPVEEVVIQDAGGTRECYEAGVDRATKLLDVARQQTRSDVGLGEATVGIVSGDFQPSTLSRAEPVVGGLVERITDAGGRTLVAANERLDAHADALRDRVATDAARAALDARDGRIHGAPARVTAARKRAADASAEEISRIWGDRPVRDVLAYGERATHESGVALVDAPAQFGEAATGLAAAGAQAVIHLTAEGNPAGHPIVPVLKLTGDDDTYEALERDIDLHAGATTPGELAATLRDVLDGRPTCAEDHGVTNFAITRVGPST